MTLQAWGNIRSNNPATKQSIFFRDILSATSLLASSFHSQATVDLTQGNLQGLPMIWVLGSTCSVPPT